MDKEYYQEKLNVLPKYNSILLSTKKVKYNENDLTKKVNETGMISYLTYTSIAEGIYKQIMVTLSYIVYILVIAAIILAFIVLYNLSNLNIEERKREIATIKVLGFNKKEVNNYMENEIKCMMVIGIIIGVVFGYFFSIILIKSCELDNLMYDYSINYLNYLYSIVLTIIFTYITCLLCRKKIKKINMVESLKKVE